MIHHGHPAILWAIKYEALWTKTGVTDKLINMNDMDCAWQWISDSVMNYKIKKNRQSR